MNLYDIYKTDGFAGLKELAEKVGSDPQYLRQCATSWRGKKPSILLAKKLIAADTRLTLEDIYASEGAGEESTA